MLYFIKQIYFSFLINIISRIIKVIYIVYIFGINSYKSCFFPFNLLGNNIFNVKVYIRSIMHFFILYKDFINYNALKLK